MKKINFRVMNLVICIVGIIVTACTATTPIPPTATPLPIPSLTPTSMPTEASLITTTGAFFALSVADVHASADWYSEKLGLKIVMQPPKTDQSTVIVLEGGGLIVELIQLDNALPLNEAAPSIDNNMLVHGIVKVGIIVEDFDKTVEILKERNVSIVLGPFPATAEQRANIIIQDNAGNLIQFFGK
jgi:hypothetical protein